MGDLYMTSDFKRDAEGNIAVKDGSVSQVNLSNPSYRGSVLPKGNIGFSNDFSWKGINFGFVVTARFGGIVMSQTQALMDAYGVSKASADARDKGGIAVNNGLVSAEKYYNHKVSHRDNRIALKIISFLWRCGRDSIVKGAYVCRFGYRED